VPVTSGLVVVDKPAGWTSHDVVARIRRVAGTRRVGHAGTLDPMATGVLVVGVERATRLLGHLALGAKEYVATIRLGQATVTDDAEGEPLVRGDAGAVTGAAVRAGLAASTGEIDQVPPSVSAVKVAGQRAYAQVRAGKEVALAPRRVTVTRLEALGSRRPAPDLLDVDVAVECSSGTYVRAIARDLGAALGVGGHLTALRRTRVGPFGLDRAATLEELAHRAAGGLDPVSIGLDEAVAAAFPRRDVDAEAARALGHGRRLAPAGLTGPYGAFGPDGHVVALVEERDGAAHPVLVFRPS
jgi:tRNA pseudouridine55 synthase